MAHVVGIDELRVGMYVHLDLSWVSHPFARSSFRIDTPAQIHTIRELGLTSLRWEPERSALPPSVASPAPATPAASPPAAGGDEAVAPKAEATAATVRRQALADQREAAEVCESQYREASQSWRRAFDRVRSHPQAARQETEALSRALRDKMLVDGELCIRVLNAAAGDRATAHAMNVAVLSMLLARALRQPAETVAAIGTGAMLHDVGKLDVPERLRQHDERFNPMEQRAYASHVDGGLSHARRMGLGTIETRVIGEHHEWADGSGFPGQLLGEAIAPAARIVALVNRFDNLCNPASLLTPLTPHEAMAQLFSRERPRCDPAVIDTFIRMMGVYPAGSVVQLADERFALVMRVNPARPLKPQVLVHDPRVPRDEALHLDLAQPDAPGIRRSLRASQLPDDVQAYLAPRERVAYFFDTGSAALAELEAAAI